MGTSYSKKQQIHDAIHLSGVPVTSISSNNQSHPKSKPPSNLKHYNSPEFLDQIRQITTSIQLSDPHELHSSNEYKHNIQSPTIDTPTTYNIQTNYENEFETDTDSDSISSNSTTTNSYISNTKSKSKYTLQTPTNYPTKGNTTQAKIKITTDMDDTKGNTPQIKPKIDEKKVNLSICTPNKLWFVGNNEHGQYDRNTKHIFDLKVMNTLPNNININNIITAYNGIARILYNNNKYIILPLQLPKNDTCTYNYTYNQLTVEHIKMISNDWCYNMQTIPHKIYELIELFVIEMDVECIENDTYTMHTKGMTANATAMDFDMDIRMISGGITSNQLFILSTNNELYTADMNKICYFENNNEYIKQIESTSYATIFLCNNGRLYQFDSGNSINNDGEDNIHIINNIKVPINNIVCGSDHTLAKCINGSVYSFGFNGSGQLGLKYKFAVYEPTLIMYFVNKNVHINMIAAGSYHNVIVDTNGKVYCFGLNSHYECGNGQTENVFLPQLNDTLKDINVVNVRCGYQHNMVCDERGNYYLWGDNRWNQCLVYNGCNEYICIPTKYDCSIDVYTKIFPGEIVDIYPGFKETRIVST